MNSPQHKLLLLTSPPASGKTYWIESFFNALDSKSLLVISPLRALADECKHRWPTILVMTPEEWTSKKISADVVIFDEFHLNFYWDSFRPILWEVFFELSTICELTVLLTATFSDEMKQQLLLMECHFDEMIWVDLGNQRLKNLPAKYYKVPSRNWLMDYLPTVKKKETNLIFCAYRQEVVKLAKFLESHDFLVWTCLGGEASAFSKKVQSETPPDFIIATSVLSHGVNLPIFKRVIFFYEVKDLNFWIQMVARGGRRGERFEVFSLENPQGIKWSRTQNILAIEVLSLRMKLILIWKEIEAWFLKASSSVKSPTKNVT